MQVIHAFTKARTQHTHGYRNLPLRTLVVPLLPVVCLIMAACAPSQPGSVSATNELLPTPTPTPYGQLPNPHPNMAGDPTNTPPPDLTGHPLPAFSDWRIAYISIDGRLHAVSLNGKADVVGQGLPIYGMNNTGVWTAGASPDGQHLAYYSGSTVSIVDVVSGTLHTYLIHLGDSPISWSPDQRHVALDGGGSVYAVNASTGATLVEPPNTNASPAFVGPFSWLDPTHVAVSPETNASATTTKLQSLDVTSGALRTITTIPLNSGGNGFTVEPDGRFTLFTALGIQNNAPNPMAELINNTTGSTTQLPQIARALNAGDGLTQLLWRPGYAQAIVATGFPQNSDLKYALIDVANDSATSLTLPGFPEAWSPDGSALIVATGDQTSNANGSGYTNIGVVGSGPYTLSAISVSAQGSMSPSVTLTTRAMDVPVLGFVHTAY